MVWHLREAGKIEKQTDRNVLVCVKKLLPGVVNLDLLPFQEIQSISGIRNIFRN